MYIWIINIHLKNPVQNKKINIIHILPPDSKINKKTKSHPILPKYSNIFPTYYKIF
jgi:hypothetical protein